MKKLIILFCLLPFLSHAQGIFIKPNNSFGTTINRVTALNTLYTPTGCGAPVGNAGLQSSPGQILQQAAIYADTCGHHIYWYHPNDSSWSRIDTSSGGVGTVTAVIISNDSVYYTTSSGNTFVFLTLTQGDSTIKYVTPTQLAAGLGPKVNYTDSTVKYVTPTQQASALTGKVNYTDSTTKYVTPTQLATKKNNNDSTAPTGYASVGNLGRMRDSLLGLLANKMTNFGGAPGWLVGTYSGIPTASTYAAGTHYTAKDSGFIYIDTGSGGTAGWKKISGGSGGSLAGAVSNFLNSQQLGYGPYASKPTTGTAFYYASDSASWFYINGATATNITAYNVYIYNQGVTGHAILRGSTDSFYSRRLRDSLDLHFTEAPDSALVAYVQAHDSTSGNALQTKYRSDTARANMYAALGLRVQSTKRSNDSVYNCYGPTNTLCVFAYLDSVGGGGQIYAYAPLHVTSAGDTTYADTSQTTTSGSHLVTQNMIYLTHRLEFIDSIPGTTYQNDRLIGSGLLNVNVGGVDVGQIANASAYWSFNNSTGTVQLYNDTLQFGDRVIIQYKRPFVDSSTYSSIIGLISTANSFSNLNAFYNNSAANAFSVSGTQIVARSLGVGMWGDGGDYLDYNLFCNDENVYLEATIRIGTQGDGLGFGLKYGPGQLDGASGSYGSVIGNFNIASLTVPKLYIWNQQTIIDSFPFPGTVAVGDSIKMRLTRTKGQFVFKVTDLNTSVTASDTATFNYTYPGNFIIPATGRMGIAKWGTGIDTIRSYTMFSNSVRDPWLVFIGDSKTTGYYAGSQSARFAELAGLNALYQPFAVYSSPGDRTQDCVNALAYIVNYVHPKNVILCIGRNDISSFGAPFWAQGQYNYERITGTLEGSGARVIHLLPIPETTLNQTSLTTFISALVGSRNTIDPTVGFVNGTMLAGDGVHPNASGHTQVSTNIINQAKIHK